MRQSNEIRTPTFAELIPTVGPNELRARINAIIEALINLLDAIDAPSEDCELAEVWEDDDPNGVPYR